ncbi:MAG: hypothetical protein ACXVIG_01390 [Halobacteriota archaeon]
MNVEAAHLDRLDLILKERINAHNGISLPELLMEYPELTNFPHSTLWYRIVNLAENGYIRAEWTDRNVICYSVE